MEDKPFAQPKSKQKKSPMKMIVGVVVAILAVVAGLVFFSGGSNDGVEAPPELSTGSGYQGFLRTQRGLIEFDADDVDDFDLTCKEKVDLESGLRAVTFSKDMTAEEVFNHIVPVKGNKFIMVYYSPGETGKKMGWHLYPVGPYVAPEKGEAGYNPNSAITEIAEDDLADFVIPAFRPVILGMTDDTEFCVTKEMQDDNIEVHPFDDNVSKTNIGSIKDLESGWALLPVQDDVEKYGDLMYADQIKSIWAIKSDGFEYKARRVGLTDAIDSKAWGVVWVNLKSPDAPAEPDPGQEEDELGPVVHLEASQVAATGVVTLSWVAPANADPDRIDKYVVNYSDSGSITIDANDVNNGGLDENNFTAKVSPEKNINLEITDKTITEGEIDGFEVYAVDTAGVKGKVASVDLPTVDVASIGQVQHLKASLLQDKSKMIVSWDKPLNVDIHKLSAYSVNVSPKTASLTSADFTLNIEDLDLKDLNQKESPLQNPKISGGGLVQFNTKNLFNTKNIDAYKAYKDRNL